MCVCVCVCVCFSLTFLSQDIKHLEATPYSSEDISLWVEKGGGVSNRVMGDL